MSLAYDYDARAQFAHGHNLVRTIQIWPQITRHNPFMSLSNLVLHIVKLGQGHDTEWHENRGLQKSNLQTHQQFIIINMNTASQFNHNNKGALKGQSIHINHIVDVYDPHNDPNAVPESEEEIQRVRERLKIMMAAMARGQQDFSPADFPPHK